MSEKLILPQQFPTAAVTRLVGRYAVCTIPHTTAVLNLTDWQVEIRTEFVDATGFGDFWDVPIPIKYLWTARGRGYFSGTVSYLRAYNAAVAAASDIVAATFTGYSDDTPSNVLFAGSGFTTRAVFMAPQTMAEQEIEIRGTGNPSTIT